MTLREVARYLRLGRHTVRGLIRRGELAAVDVGGRGRPRLVVLPDALDAFVRGRQVVPQRSRPAARRRPPNQIDFYP
jgi:excisionase family DNA binding protein